MVYLGKSVVKDMHVGAKPELFRSAQDMRKNPTEGEKTLWTILRKFLIPSRLWSMMMVDLLNLKKWHKGHKIYKRSGT